MPRGIQHAEEFERIAHMEHNIAIDQTDMFGPQRRFEEKGQSSNPTAGGGINRSLQGKGQGTKHYHGSKQAKDGGPKTYGSPKPRMKHSPAHKYHGHGG